MRLSVIYTYAVQCSRTLQAVTIARSRTEIMIIGFYLTLRFNNTYMYIVVNLWMYTLRYSIHIYMCTVGQSTGSQHYILL